MIMESDFWAVFPKNGDFVKVRRIEEKSGFYKLHKYSAKSNWV
jgi:hypothetical protein